MSLAILHYITVGSAQRHITKISKRLKFPTEREDKNNVASLPSGRLTGH